MSDQDALLNLKTRHTFEVPPSGSIVAGINALLDQIPIFNREVPADGSVVVGSTRIWPPGTQRSTILNELCLQAGWLPPYFDNNGTLVIRPPSELSIYADHTYGPNRLKLGTPIANKNLLEAPNVFVVICNGPTKGDISASAQVDPSLPFSVENRGREVVHEHRAQGITSSQQAQQMADRMAAGATDGFLERRFTSPPDPRHDLFQTIYYKGDQKAYRELGFAFSSLTPGADMTHQLSYGGFDVG